MSTVAVTGDACTTTAVALAAAWPLHDDVVLVEADPTGGDLAAWFDLPESPSLSTAVTQVTDGSWPEIEALTRLAPSGLRVLPAPVRRAEADQAVSEAARSLAPTLANLRSPVAIADIGAISTARPNPFADTASVTVAVHRQSPQSPRAAAVRLQRFADALGALATNTATTTATGPLVVAVVGSSPFDVREIESFLVDTTGASQLVGLPVDDLTAAVLAGRRGVSERRLARLPLMRAARDLAAVTDRALAEATNGLSRAAT